MILSHRHRFIFLKTVKVGGTSLEIALSKFCGPKDIITRIDPRDEPTRQRLGFPGPQNYSGHARHWNASDWKRLLADRRMPTKFHDHIPAHRVRQMVGADVWSSYYKFSVVRNPFEALVSRYFWDMQDQTPQPFDHWLRTNPERILHSRRVYEIDGEVAVDRLLRFEHLEEDLAEVAATVGLPENPYQVMQSVRAKSGVRDRRRSTASFFADDDTRRLVEILSKETIDRFGYSLPPEPAGTPARPHARPEREATR